MPDYLVYRFGELPEEVADISLLDTAELAAYAKRGLFYLLARCLLKREIARRLGIAPADVHLQIGGQGKPHFPGIHFNISHSAGLLCLAFHHAPIGVDIECIRPRKRIPGLAARIMSPEQLRYFTERGCRKDEFYACWCSAEALVKHAGLGIGCAKRFPFLYRQGNICMQGDTPAAVELFTPAPGFQGALAY